MVPQAVESRIPLEYLYQADLSASTRTERGCWVRAAFIWATLPERTVVTYWSVTPVPEMEDWQDLVEVEDPEV